MAKKDISPEKARGIEEIVKKTLEVPSVSEREREVLKLDIENGKERKRLEGSLAVMRLAQEEEPDKKALKALTREEKKLYKRCLELPPATLQKKIKQIEKLLQPNNEISAEAKEKLENAQKSWWGKLKTAVKKFGSGVWETIKKIPEKIKEFASTRTGKKILIGGAVVLTIAALAGVYFWLMGGSIAAGTDLIVKEGKEIAKKTLKESTGGGWDLPPGILDTAKEGGSY